MRVQRPRGRAGALDGIDHRRIDRDGPASRGVRGYANGEPAHARFELRSALRRATVALLEVIDRWRLARYSPVFGISSEASRQSMRQRLVALFERGQHDGTIRDDLEPVALSIAFGGLLSAALSYFETMGIDDAADLIVQVLLGPAV